MASYGYIPCMNAHCVGLKNGGNCWRPIHKGPDRCPKCDEPFRVTKFHNWKSGASGGKGYGGRKAGKVVRFQDDAGTGKGKGRDVDSSESSWQFQDSKGRTRPSPSPRGGDPNGGQTGMEIDDSVVEAAIRAKLATSPQYQELAQNLLQDWFPKKEKTEQERMREGRTAVDSAQAEVNQLTNQSASMQAAYDRKFQDLIEYKDKLDAVLGKLENSKVVLESAKEELLELQAADLHKTSGPPLQLSKVQEVAASFDPTAGIAQALKNCQGVQSISEATATEIGEAMVLSFRQQMDFFYQQFAAPHGISNTPKVEQVRDVTMVAAAARRKHEEISTEMENEGSGTGEAGAQSSAAGPPTEQSVRACQAARELSDKVEHALKNRRSEAPEGQSSS